MITQTETQYWFTERSGMFMEQGHSRIESDRLAMEAFRNAVSESIKHKKQFPTANVREAKTGYLTGCEGTA